MSYLIRVLLPDTPGSLGKLADAFGEVQGNIQSVDVVEVLPDHTAMDDIVVTLPQGALPDSLISAAQQVEGVEVDSIRPFSGTVDRRGQIRLLASVGAARRDVTKAAQELVDTLPRTMSSGWAILLDANATGATRVAASPAAPEDDGRSPQLPTIDSARTLDPESESWIPETWALLDSALAVAPLANSSMVLVVGRPGGPDFLASEVEHLGNLGFIVGTMLKH